jgi:rhodanese-related sulfurtransferase
VFGHSVLPSVTVGELADLLAADATTPLVDVREPDEYAGGHVEGAVLVPMGVLPVRVDEIPRDRTVYVICHSGGRSGQVVGWLNQQGYDAVNVEGGTAGWAMSGRPVV